MSNKRMAVLVVVLLLVNAVCLAADAAQQPQPRGGRGGMTQGGPMLMIDQLDQAYQQKDMAKIGQIIDQMKQARQAMPTAAGQPGSEGRGMGRMGPGGGAGGAITVEKVLAKDDAEKKILDVLEELGKSRTPGGMNVPVEEGRFLRLITEAVGAKNVVEIGTSNGYSGIWFCLAMTKTNGKLITHEIDKGRAQMARDNFKKAGVDTMVTLVEGDAHETVKNLKDPIDVLFIDADKEGYADYLKQLLPLVRPGGIIVAHNTTNAASEVAGYVKDITTNPELETLFINTAGRGMAVSLKKR